MAAVSRVLALCTLAAGSMADCNGKDSACGCNDQKTCCPATTCSDLSSCCTGANSTTPGTGCSTNYNCCSMPHCCALAGCGCNGQLCSKTSGSPQCFAQGNCFDPCVCTDASTCTGCTYGGASRTCYAVGYFIDPMQKYRRHAEQHGIKHRSDREESDALQVWMAESSH